MNSVSAASTSVSNRKAFTKCKVPGPAGDFFCLRFVRAYFRGLIFATKKGDQTAHCSRLIPRFACLRERPEQDACDKRCHDVPGGVVADAVGHGHPDIEEDYVRGVDVEAVAPHDVRGAEVEQAGPGAHDPADGEHKQEEVREAERADAEFVDERGCGQLERDKLVRPEEAEQEYGKQCRGGFLDDGHGERGCGGFHGAGEPPPGGNGGPAKVHELPAERVEVSVANPCGEERVHGVAQAELRGNPYGARREPQQEDGPLAFSLYKKWKNERAEQQEHYV